MLFEWLDYAILIPYLVAMVCLMVFGAHRYLLLYQFRHVKCRPLEPPARFASLPVVTVQLPLYNERYVARRLIDQVCALEYPSDRMEIQVLDDSDDDTRQIIAERVTHWRARGLDIRHVRRPGRAGFKAGALAWGMARARGEFMLIFDADFVPPADLLVRSIHYLSDPNVGMVQMRWGHINRNFSLLTRLQSIFLDGHFVIEHSVRHRLGRFFNFNGTAGIWRRQAIIEAGGWSADTLTEDLDLSYRAQMTGWKFVYLPDVAAPAELPVDIGAFKNQQYRWARGSVQTARKILPRLWRSHLPRSIKLEATVHLTANFAYLFLLLPVTLALPAMIRMYRTERLEILALYVAFFVFATLSVWVFFGVSQRATYPDWRRILFLFPLLMSLGIGMALNNARAVLSGLWSHSGEFVRTPKYGVLPGARRTHRSGYRSRRSGTVLLEFIYVAYFAFTIYYAIKEKMFGALPYLTIFFAGFAYVATLSAWQRWRERLSL